MFYDQLKAACLSSGTSITAVLKKLGIGTANGTYWKNGSMPNSDIVVKLSELLCVSTDYLLTGKESKQSSPNISYNYTAQEQSHIKKYRTLDQKGKHTVDETLDAEYIRCSSKSILKVVSRDGTIIHREVNDAEVDEILARLEERESKDDF